MTTRKNSNSIFRANKAEIHKKLTKITHEYSESTNVNSKGSSAAGSINEKLVTKTAHSRKESSNIVNLVPHVINKNKKFLQHMRNAGSNENMQTNFHKTKDEPNKLFDRTNKKLIYHKLRGWASTQKSHRKTRNNQNDTAFISVINYKLSNNSWERLIKNRRERINEALLQNSSNDSLLDKIKEENQRKLGILNRLLGLDQKRLNEATCITTETYAITRQKDEDEPPSIFNESTNSKNLKRRNTSFRGLRKMN